MKDGCARLILVDTQVCEFIQSTPASYDIPMPLEAEEPPVEYVPGICTPAYQQIVSAINNMAHSEQEEVAQFLSRGGIRNFLTRLDIDEST